MPLLTDIVIRNAKVPAPGADGRVVQADLWDEGIPGFGLRLSSTGKKSWIVAVRLLREGRRVSTRLVLGSYPGMSLAEAREKAREAKVMASEHRDPREAREREKAARVSASKNTFGGLADEFLKKYAEGNALRASTVRGYRITLKGPDSGPWQKRAVASITKADVIAVLDQIVARGSPVAANNFLVYVRKFFGWCAERSIIERSPTEGLSRPSKVTARDRALSPDEIREVWSALDRLETSEEPQVRGDMFAAIFKLLLLTGQRRDEVAGMQWDELRGLGSPDAAWEIGGGRTKNHRPHVVPLAPLAAAILSRAARIAQSSFVFTTTGSSRVSGFSKAKFRLDVAITTARLKQGVTEPMVPFVLHDFRRTVSTRMHEDLGIAPHIVEAVLNHVSGFRAGVAGTYNRALYADEKRRALEAWSAYVHGLVAPGKRSPGM